MWSWFSVFIKGRECDLLMVGFDAAGADSSGVTSKYLTAGTGTTGTFYDRRNYLSIIRDDAGSG